MVETLDRKFETVSKGIGCGHSSSAEYVVRNDAEWQTLGKITFQNPIFATDGTPSQYLKIAPPVIPEVDFANEMVLGVYQGQKDSSYGIEISKLVETDNCLEVHVIESTPPELERILEMGWTQPYHLVKTTQTDKEVKFIR